MFLWGERKEKDEDEIYKETGENLIRGWKTWKNKGEGRESQQREGGNSKRERPSRAQDCAQPPSLVSFHVPPSCPSSSFLCFWLCPSELNGTRKACLSSQALSEWWTNTRLMHSFSVLFKKRSPEGSFTLHSFGLWMCVLNALTPNYFVTISLGVQDLHLN